jgi:hypothetical protein
MNETKNTDRSCPTTRASHCDSPTGSLRSSRYLAAGLDARAGNSAADAGTRRRMGDRGHHDVHPRVHAGDLPRRRADRPASHHPGRIEFVRRCRPGPTRRERACRRLAGVWVEAELGALAGDENVSTNATAGELTDPDLAVQFAARTGVDALAVAVGNVHGLTATPIRLDLERLRKIATLTPVPLVLHGASGLLEEDLTGAVAAGLCKVNFNAELRRAYLGALAANRMGSELDLADAACDRLGILLQADF